MGWLLRAVVMLVVALLEILGHKHDWIKEEINSKPNDSVI